MRQIILSLFLISGILSAHADEGMWMLTDLKQQNEVAMTELGLLIPAEQIYNPNGIALKDAVVHFGGGCTGEVISAEGLVLTNHHCGYGAIQQHSSVEHDYLTDGFWTMSRSEELPCKGLTVTYIDEIMDVTDYVNDQLQIDSDPNGTNYLSPKYLAMIADRFLSAQGITLTSGRKAELKAFYGGNKYYLFLKTTYSDIRMVGAPPSSIGKFGADTDNWMWPRHTGDFSLFRIYASKDGQPSAYNPDNVPLQVKKHLTISLAGYREGDFTFVMGFPGRNWRYMISDEVEERMQTTNFMRHHVRDVRQKALMEQMLKDDAVRIHYASKYASSANYWKNAIGMNEGLVRLKILDTKRAQQEQLLARGRALNDSSYQKAFDQIRGIVKHRRNALYHQQAIQEALVTGLDFMRIPPPARQITPERQPDLAAACQRTLEIRGDGGTGWAMAWKINFWARLRDGNHAFGMLKNGLRYVDATQVSVRGGGTYANLFDAHPPFQIDGNFGGTAGITEMLLQSHAGYIHLLPALPDNWQSGSIKGVRARGGFTIDMEWKESRITRLSVTSHSGGTCRIREATSPHEEVIETEKGKTYQVK